MCGDDYHDYIPTYAKFIKISKDFPHCLSKRGMLSIEQEGVPYVHSVAPPAPTETNTTF